ncbi:MAG: Gldg family protein [Ruminococcus sp.]|nr:Gldg family protein [Ruminococcus sp.]
MEKKKFDFSGAFAIVLAILILLIFIPINMIFAYRDKVFDMTPSGQYTLNPITKDLLERTSDKKIDVYFLSQLNDLQEVPKYLPLYHTLTELEKHDNITLTCFDPNKDVEMAQSLDPSGTLSVNPADIFIKCDGITKKVSFIRCFPTDSNDILMYEGEELIAGAIELCTSGSLPTVYFLSGYGKTTLADYSNYADAIKTDNYNVEELDLSTVEDIPDNAAILYLVAPQKDISDSDYNKLKAYTDNGGALSIIIPPCDTKGRFKNIELLLAQFELGMHYNTITERSSMLQANVVLASNALTEDMIYATQDDSALITARDKILERFVKVSYPYPNSESTVDLTTDLNSKIQDSDAGIYPYVSNTRSFFETISSGEQIEKFSIIENLTLEQNSSSYTTVSTPMGGDDDTAEVAESVSNSPLVFGYYSYNKQTGAKLFLIGTDDAISNDRWTMATTGTRMLTLFSNTWLYNSDIDMGIGAKSNSYDTLTFEDSNEASRTIKLFFIIPAVFLVAGLAVWLKRRYA